MSIEGLIVGIIAILVGLGLCFAGLKYFLLLLPVWGAIVGFVIGSNMMHHLFGLEHPFLGGTTGIIVGIVVAVAFAILSYLYYYFAVIVAGGAIGFLAGIGIMGIIGLNGPVAWIVGIVVAVIFAIAFIQLAMPIWLAIWATAIGGASAIITGLAVLLGTVKVADMNYGFLTALWNAPNVGIIWIAAGVVLAIVGVFAQLRMIGEAAQAISKQQYQNPGM